MEINVEKRIKNSFARQTVMTTIGASITRVKPGEVSVEVPFRSDLTQQHGFFSCRCGDHDCGYRLWLRRADLYARRRRGVDGGVQG